MIKVNTTCSCGGQGCSVWPDCLPTYIATKPA